MHISQRARNTAPSPTLAITARAKALAAQGKDVIGFGAGEPDFDTPDHIKQAAVAALEAGYTKYTPSSGDADLKQAIVEKLARDNGLHYKPSQVIVSCGAKHSLYNIMQALLDPGDEVIIPVPYWVTYPEQVKLADGVPVFVPTDPKNDFMPTREALRQAITSRTRAIVLNSPCNPTGAVASRQTIKEIVSLCIQHQIYLISDEIYEKLIYDGRQHVSPAALGSESFQYTITVNGCSKAYSMTGWRIGYVASANEEFIAAMGRLQDQSTSNPTSIAQKAAVAALLGPQEPVEQMRQAFEARRNAMVERLNAMPGVHCPMPGGAFYAFPDISALLGRKAGSKVIASSDALAEFLLDEAGVAVVPGSGFGADTHIRLSYATSMEKIEKGLERMAQALRKLE
ncbi:pyridoxal phosphate-dependent aminotransferase [Chthonomonas calidirosea]|uniref:Aminotransferase n=1 Tax=Chthonomonas calidirosea (strain DSM 23976 / ICMP 18418 / T49) TaxID=1303518 RepID=S0ETT7_CHTCT|nr:pyridoxal phosphate-dependent aminotransferase [Chthonomonas calidirosea]CCW34640.1 L-aspartate aminotransferase apoenzyme [Chthonomonas calidirosea T49]CEK13056.1 L-aspartate aminotransferase apoenzyme [Chthonomonas calidirosea]CEK14208.1 L-aspartate aminotransferase apoenzyme [Chthonomonas calidirosea]